MRPALRMLARLTGTETVLVEWDVATEMWSVRVPGDEASGPSLERCVDRLIRSVQK